MRSQSNFVQTKLLLGMFKVVTSFKHHLFPCYTLYSSLCCTNC